MIGLLIALAVICALLTLGDLASRRDRPGSRLGRLLDFLFPIPLSPTSDDDYQER